MSKRIFLIAGEASGDLQGAFLIHEIKQKLPDIEIKCVGGVHMKQEGAQVIADIGAFGCIGPWNALPRIPAILHMLHKIKVTLKQFKPDLLIMIDSPAINMRIGKFAKQHGIKTAYYFPPSAWYSAEKRVKKIASVSDYIIPVFKYNVDTYKKAGVDCHFFGHPILDLVAQKQKDNRDTHTLSEGKQLLALLPGSRVQEVDALMPIYVKTMFKLIEREPEIHFLIPIAFKHVEHKILKYLEGVPKDRYTIFRDGAYQVFKHARVAITASGSATLEATINKVPIIVVYRLAMADWILAKMFIKIPFFALPNLLAGKKIVPEYIQDDVNPTRLTDEAIELLHDEVRRNEMISELVKVKESLGNPGAVKAVANFICQILSNSSNLQN